MKKIVSVLTVMALLVMSMAGCGENKIPELTEEEMQSVGEYAAITMMKYDAGRRSRLVDISLLGLPDPTPEPEPSQTPAGMDPVEDTPVVNVSSGTAESGTFSTIESALGLPEGLMVEYTGQELHSTYPENEIGGFAITAVEGKQLLVLNFLMTNASDQDQEIDFLGMAPEYRITVNGSYTRKALMTMLENDMATYVGTVPASQSVPLVLVTELEDEDAANITSISISLKSASNSCTLQLL